MNIQEFNTKLQKVYPILSVKLDNCGIANMFSNDSKADEYQELNLYQNDQKVKTLMSGTVITNKEISGLLDKHYQEFIEPKQNQIKR